MPRTREAMNQQVAAFLWMDAAQKQHNSLLGQLRELCQKRLLCDFLSALRPCDPQPHHTFAACVWAECQANALPLSFTGEDYRSSIADHATFGEAPTDGL